MRAVDDPVVLARLAALFRAAKQRLAALFRRALLRPCPDIAAGGVECDRCTERRAEKDEAGGVDPAGPETNPSSPNEKVLPDDARSYTAE